MEASQHAALFQQDIDPIDLHGDNSNIWGPKIDRMRISEYKIMPDVRKSICTIQNEVLFTPDDGVSNCFIWTFFVTLGLNLIEENWKF